MAYRNGRSGGRARSAGARQFERDFGEEHDPDYGPRSPGRRTARRRPGKMSRHKGRNSSDYQRGLRAGRQQMAAMLAPDDGYERDPDGQYGGDRSGYDREVGAPGVRIGYRL